MFEKKVVIGKILNGLKGISAYQVEVLKDKEFIAAKWTFKGKHNGTPEVTFFIHRNGKISVYYKDISTESFQNQLEFKIGRDFQCEAGKTEHKIAVPVEWIRNGTLVEYEVIGTICPIHNSSEACKKATTSNIKCIWCEKWNTCIDSNHQDSHFFKVNGCHYKNATIETTQESGQNKSLWYLYIVIPSVIFFAVCIGWVIWRWLYKRRRYNE
ncbi:hypothetical protein MS3_00000325 [Schistosoma haematobium]|uniref:Egg protein CP391S-like protein n=1 Tax=Schistosoma haematobium TaxID=6185 RepID=A0A922LIJ7_SCHHA|nr:hypothetical protein MS3_00000325 [Schistosoma haematobium]KAH9586070.1 hypothetical protein MS3_00000325 [Schistosoma haematobium]